MQEWLPFHLSDITQNELEEELKHCREVSVIDDRPWIVTLSPMPDGSLNVGVNLHDVWDWETFVVTPAFFDRSNPVHADAFDVCFTIIKFMASVPAGTGHEMICRSTMIMNEKIDDADAKVDQSADWRTALEVWSAAA